MFFFIYYFISQWKLKFYHLAKIIKKNKQKIKKKWLI